MRTMVRFSFMDDPTPALPARAGAPPYDAAVSGPLELPQAAGPRAERVDAARNRAAIIEAAERLLRDHGAEAITMDRLACEAGVGKGTLFRRFGDRANLFHALLDEAERRLQEGFIRGPAPLGPGAPPKQRLIAFGHALLALTRERGDLLLASQPPEPMDRYQSPVHAAYRAHISYLLRELEVPHADYVADVLLAALAPELVLHQIERGMTVEECGEAWQNLVIKLLAVLP
jgi:AcrR family transcriptional regulator